MSGPIDTVQEIWRPSRS